MGMAGVATNLFITTKEILGIISNVKDLSDLRELLIELKPEDIYLKSLREILKQQQVWLLKKEKTLFYEDSLEQFQDELRRKGKALDKLLLSDSITEPENVRTISKVLEDTRIFGGIDFNIDTEPGWGEKIQQDTYNSYLNSMYRKCPQIENAIHSRKIKDAIQAIQTNEDNIREKLGELERLNRNLWSEILEYIQPQLKFAVPLETNLSWKTNQKGKYFRDGSPIWIDYRDGFVFKPRNVDHILDGLNKNKIFLLIGASGFGKSVTVRYVGYKLRHAGYEVYIHQVTDRTNFYELANEVSSFKSSKTVFIIEDLNIQLDESMDIINRLQNNTNDCLILLTTRPYDQSQVREGQRDVLEELPSLTIYNNRAFIEEMLNQYSKSIGYSLDENDLKAVNQICGADLYLLNYLLQNWDHSRLRLSEINLETFYHFVHTKRLAGKDLKPLLILSALYQFEIPCQRGFIAEETLLIKEKFAIPGGEGSNFLYLNHSSAARLYLKVAFYFNDAPTKKYKDEGDFTLAIIRLYLLESPNNFDVVLDRLSSAREFKIINSIISDPKILDLIRRNIDKTHNTSRIARALRAISEVNQIISYKIIDDINLDSIAAKLNKEGLFETSSIISTIGHASRSLIKIIDQNRLISQINSCQEIQVIGFAFRSLSKGAWDLANEFAKKIDLDIISDKLSQEKNVLSITYCINGIAQANLEVSDFLLEKYGVDRLADQLNNENNYHNLSLCIFYIAFPNRKNGKHLAKKLDTKRITNKLNGEKKLRIIGNCIWAFRIAEPKFSFEITTTLDKSLLKEKIEREFRTEEISRFLHNLFYANPKVAWKVLGGISFDVFVEKIYKNSSVAQIGYLLSSIANIDQVYAEQLVDNIFIKYKVTLLIDKLYNNMALTSRLYMYFVGLSSANKEKAIEFIKLIDIDKFSFELEKKFNIRDIGHTLSVLANLDPITARKVANAINISKLQEQLSSVNNLGSMVMCLRGLFKSDQEIAWEIVSNTWGTIISLIKTADNLQSVGECLEVILQSNPEVAKKVINEFSKLDLRSKIENEARIEHIAILIRALYISDPSIAYKTIKQLTPAEIAYRLNHEKDLGSLAHAINILFRYIPELVAVDKLSMENLTQRIHVETIIEKVTEIFLAIGKINLPFAKTLVRNVNKTVLKVQINENPDINKSSKLIRVINSIEENSLSKLIDMGKVKNRISNLQNLRRISNALFDFKNTDENLARELLAFLDVEPLLSRELDAGKVLEFLGTVYAINKDDGRRIIARLKRSKIHNILKQINEEDNPIKFGLYILMLNSINHQILNGEILAKISIETFGSNIKNNTLWHTCWALWMIGIYDYDKATSLTKAVFLDLTKTNAATLAKLEINALHKAIILAGFSIRFNLELTTEEILWWKSTLSSGIELNIKNVIVHALVFAYPDIEVELGLKGTTYQISTDDAIETWIAIWNNIYKDDAIDY